MDQTKHFGFVAVCLVFLISSVLLPASAQGEGIRFDALQIPAVIAGSSFELEAVVVQPDDRQLHPLAVINHGSPRDPQDPKGAGSGGRAAGPDLPITD
jgi:hypothetical protein